jgi:L-galactose dehydrogenase
MRDEGLCRYVGMTGYPIATMTRALRETRLDVLLTYAHATLLDDSLQRDLAPWPRNGEPASSTRRQ